MNGLGSTKQKITSMLQLVHNRWITAYAFIHVCDTVYMQCTHTHMLKDKGNIPYKTLPQVEATVGGGGRGYSTCG